MLASLYERYGSYIHAAVVTVFARDGHYGRFRAMQERQPQAHRQQTPHGQPQYEQSDQSQVRPDYQNQPSQGRYQSTTTGHQQPITQGQQPQTNQDRRQSTMRGQQSQMSQQSQHGRGTQKGQSQQFSEVAPFEIQQAVRDLAELETIAEWAHTKSMERGDPHVGTITDHLADIAHLERELVLGQSPFAQTFAQCTEQSIRQGIQELQQHQQDPSVQDVVEFGGYAAQTLEESQQHLQHWSQNQPGGQIQRGGQMPQSGQMEQMK